MFSTKPYGLSSSKKGLIKNIRTCMDPKKLAADALHRTTKYVRVDLVFWARGRVFFAHRTLDYGEWPKYSPLCPEYQVLVHVFC